MELVAARSEMRGTDFDWGPRASERLTMGNRGFAFACVTVAVAGCGGGSGNGSQGFGVGGPTMCGQVSPCAGDLTGIWNLTTE
jgi:hypothetical protein